MVVNMAAKETVNGYRADTEATVNRWIVDYYTCLALELFKNEEYAAFCDVRDLLHNVVARPLEGSDVMSIKLKVLQFLSRINDGENLDLLFESDKSITPLESALFALEGLSQESSTSLPQQEFEKVYASLTEMMVALFIKNDEFNKAKEVLNKYFPKPMVGKKAIFMGLIKRKIKTHEVIEQINFQRFREEMMTFCQSLCPFSVPFLQKAATQLIEKKKMEQKDTATGSDEQEDMAAGPDEPDEAGPSSRPQISSIQFVPCKHTIIQRTRLEAAYKVLAAGSDERSSFALLEEEVEREEQVRKEALPLSPTPRKNSNQDSEQDGLFQRDSGSPMEASPADQPPQTDAAPHTQAGYLSKTPSVRRNRHSHNVARLVVEQDSQGSSQCTAVSQEMDTDVRTEEPPQSPAITNKKDTQSLLTIKEVTIPLRKIPRRVIKNFSRTPNRLVELSDSEEGSSGSDTNGEILVGKSHNQTNISLSSSPTMIELSLSDSEDPQESPTPCQTPVQKPREKPASDPLSKVPDVMSTTDCSLHSSPELFPLHPVPQTSSTPQKDSAQDKRPSHSKWKRLYSDVKESKDTWSDEESYFTSKKKNGSHSESPISNSSNRRKWSEQESQMLKEGVKKFGEGNWSKIKAYYSFGHRTNVNLKDRWRTMKNSNMA